MPIPSTVADLSTTASANYPSGSESPNTVDDYLRAQASIIRQVSDASVSLSGTQTLSNKTLDSSCSLAGNAATATTATNATNASTATTATTANAGPNSTPFSFRNRIINGDMRIDQRNAGASQTITAAAALAYSVDRWYAYCTGANVTGQRVAGSIANTYRYQFTGAASVTGVGFGTRLEADNTAMLAGSTTTLQCKLKSSSLTSITWTAYYANSKDAFGTLASPTRTQIATGTFTITSTEATYSTSISIPSAATTGIEIVLTGGALLGSQTLTIGDVQLEPGSIATPFENRPIGTEFSLCQRYYQEVRTLLSTSANTFQQSWPVFMRTTPTLVLVADSGSGGVISADGVSSFRQTSVHSVLSGALLKAPAEL